MPSQLAIVVRQRALCRCEYCHLPDAVYAGTFEMEHIISRQHNGPTILGNLAHSCLHCNRNKGPNLASIDWQTSRTKLVRLFHPRRHKWDHHFRWEGTHLIGKTAIGRVTISLLFMNDPDRIELRQLLLLDGLLQQ